MSGTNPEGEDDIFRSNSSDHGNTDHVPKKLGSKDSALGSNKFGSKESVTPPGSNFASKDDIHNAALEAAQQPLILPGLTHRSNAASRDNVFGSASSDESPHSSPPLRSLRASVTCEGEEKYVVHLSDEEVAELRISVNTHRFLQLALGIAISTMGAVSYAFGLMSNYIKEKNGFTQSQMTTISTIGSVFAAFGFPGGIIFDLFGAQYTVLVQGISTGLGFLVMALAFKGAITASVPILAVGNALISWGGSFADTGGVMTNLFNFPLNKGHVVIIQKTFGGLGSTFFSLMYDAFFSDDNYFGYAIFAVGYVVVITILGVIFMRIPAYHPTWLSQRVVSKSSEEEQAAAKVEEEKSFAIYHDTRFIDFRRLNLGFIVLWITLLYFSADSIVNAFITMSTRVAIVLGVLAILCLLIFWLMALPIDLPAFFDFNFLPSLSADKDREVDIAYEIAGVNERLPEDRRGTRTGANADEGDTQRKGSVKSDAGDNAHTHTDANDEELAAANAARMIQTTCLGSLLSFRRPILLCFCWNSFCVAGYGYLYTNNAPQIYIALLNGGFYDSRLSTLYVALTGIGSAFGRVIVGYIQLLLSERVLALHTRQTKLKQLIALGLVNESDIPAEHLIPVHHHWLSSVTVLVPLPAILMTLACLFVLVLPASALGLPFLVAGAAIGAVIGAQILSAREIFAVQPAMHFNCCNLASIISTGITNSAMFGPLYTSLAAKQAEEGIAGSCDNCCSGLDCIKDTFILGVAINASSILGCAYIAYAWRQRRIEADEFVVVNVDGAPTE